MGRLKSLGSRSTASESRACTTIASPSRLRLRSSILMSAPSITRTASTVPATTAVVIAPDWVAPPEALLDAWGTTTWAQPSFAGQPTRESAAVMRAVRVALIVFMASPPGPEAAKSVPSTHSLFSGDLRLSVSPNVNSVKKQRQLLHEIAVTSTRRRSGLHGPLEARSGEALNVTNVRCRFFRRDHVTATRSIAHQRPPGRSTSGFLDPGVRGTWLADLGLDLQHEGGAHDPSAGSRRRGPLVHIARRHRNDGSD